MYDCGKNMVNFDAFYQLRTSHLRQKLHTLQASFPVIAFPNGQIDVSFWPRHQDQKGSLGSWPRHLATKWWHFLKLMRLPACKWYKTLRSSHDISCPSLTILHALSSAMSNSYENWTNLPFNTIFVYHV